MTEREALITKKYILAHQQIKFFGWIFFRQKLRLKKNLQNGKIELAKNVEYDSAWGGDPKKLYFYPSKINFYDGKFFVRKWSEKNFFKIGK